MTNGNRAAMPTNYNITLQPQTADSDRLSVLFVVLDLVILFCIVEDLFEYMGMVYAGLDQLTIGYLGIAYSR